MDQRDAALLWSTLNILTRERYAAVLEVFGNLTEAARHLNAEFLQGLGCRRDGVERLLLLAEEFQPEAARRQLDRAGVRLFTMDDPEFPASLIDVPDGPVFLYVRGDLTSVNQPGIGVVGTRKMTPYGRRLVEHFVPAFVRAGALTVSGLAAGIDTVVASETLAAGGRTVAVLGHGLGAIYPRANTALAERIVASGGVLLSEFPFTMPPDTYTFPARNRLIAGLSLGTLVIEAPAESGALITADLAFDYNKPVWAAPGLAFDPNFRGSHALIASDRAKLVTDPEEVLRDLRISVAPARASTYQPADAVEATVFAALTPVPQRTDALVERTGLDPGTLGAVLTVLELAGAAKNTAGEWVRL